MWREKTRTMGSASVRSWPWPRWLPDSIQWNRRGVSPDNALDNGVRDCHASRLDSRNAVSILPRCLFGRHGSGRLDMIYIIFLLAFVGTWFFVKKTIVLSLYVALLNEHLLYVLCPFSGPPPKSHGGACRMQNQTLLFTFKFQAHLSVHTKKVYRKRATALIKCNQRHLYHQHEFILLSEGH